MKVLVIGSGGREHALVWALARSSHVKQLYNNSTNAGILRLATHVNESSISGLANFAASEEIDLTVVGPEQPLVDGVVDAFARFAAWAKPLSLCDAAQWGRGFFVVQS